MSNKKAYDLFGLVGRALDDYDVERVVAAGGFGIVYFARHNILKQPVAIKVMKVPPGLTEADRATFLKLFLEEAQTIAALKHPAIVGVQSFKVSPMPAGGQAPWMALDWIEGDTLAEQLAPRRGQGGRAPRECLRILDPVFDAIAFAHAQGVAHRDLKPANLMIPRAAANVTGRFGAMTRVLDFGIAKAMKSHEVAGSGYTETASQFQAFSLPYAAMEQVSGTRTGPWTDVHALALILTEMLTDEEPYRAEDRGELMQQVLSPVRPTPAQHGVDVGPWEPVLARALALKPAERYPNAGEFLAALEQNVPAQVRRTLSGQTLPTTQPLAQAPQVPAVTISTTVPVTADRRMGEAPGNAAAVTRRGRQVAVATVVTALVGVAALGLWWVNRTPNATTASAGLATMQPASQPAPQPPAAVPTRPAPVPTTANTAITAPQTIGGSSGMPRTMHELTRFSASAMVSAPKL